MSTIQRNHKGRVKLDPLENPKDFVGKSVHIQGLNREFSFVLLSTDNITHKLKSTGSGKVFETHKKLLPTVKFIKSQTI
jgi:hypothetical protein